MTKFITDSDVWVTLFSTAFVLLQCSANRPLAMSTRRKRLTKWEKVYSIDTCDWFHKHFMRVTYCLSKIRCTTHWMHAPLQCFQNVLAYFVMVVSYSCKMSMKLTPGCWERSPKTDSRASSSNRRAWLCCHHCHKTFFHLNLSKIS